MSAPPPLSPAHEAALELFVQQEAVLCPDVKGDKRYFTSIALTHAHFLECIPGGAELFPDKDDFAADLAAHFAGQGMCCLKQFFHYQRGRVTDVVGGMRLDGMGNETTHASTDLKWPRSTDNKETQEPRRQRTTNANGCKLAQFDQQFKRDNNTKK